MAVTRGEEALSIIIEKYGEFWVENVVACAGERDAKRFEWFFPQKVEQICEHAVVPLRFLQLNHLPHPLEGIELNMTAR
jgi:hypothetical protein